MDTQLAQNAGGKILHWQANAAKMQTDYYYMFIHYEDGHAQCNALVTEYLHMGKRIMMPFAERSALLLSEDYLKKHHPDKKMDLHPF